MVFLSGAFSGVLPSFLVLSAWDASSCGLGLLSREARLVEEIGEEWLGGLAGTDLFPPTGVVDRGFLLLGLDCRVSVDGSGFGVFSFRMGLLPVEAIFALKKEECFAVDVNGDVGPRYM
jgi:hypothetical protein